MDKVKNTVKKGVEKVTKTDQEPLQESNRDAPQTTWPTREQHSSMTGGIDTHMGKSAHSSDVTGLTGKDSIGQPTNKPTG